MHASILIQLLLNGLIAGSIYGMIAVGYAMVYSILRFINFAHGYIAMIGMYLAYTFSSFCGLNFLVSCLLAVICSALLGLLIERVAYKPLRKTFYLAPLITSVGVSYSLEAIALLIWGADVRSYNLQINRNFTLLGARITEVQVIIIVVLALSIALLAWLLKKTPLGIAIRAAADDFDMCSLVGVDGDQIISAVFVIGSALAGIAGILLGMNTNLETTIGLVVTIKAFAAIILGGLGNIYSCVLGGLIIGLAENLGIWYLPSVWKDAVAYVILFAILLVKPSGLLGGKREAEVKL